MNEPVDLLVKLFLYVCFLSLRMSDLMIVWRIKELINVYMSIWLDQTDELLQTMILFLHLPGSLVGCLLLMSELLDLLTELLIIPYFLYLSTVYQNVTYSQFPGDVGSQASVLL